MGPDLRSLVLALVQAAPVSDFLAFSAYTPGAGEPIPITSLRSERIASRAA